MHGRRQFPPPGTGVKHRGGELTLPVRQRPSYVRALSKVTPAERAEPVREAISATGPGAAGKWHAVEACDGHRADLDAVQRIA
jgi:hypothetical protein